MVAMQQNQLPPRPPTWLSAVGRAIGFLLFAGTGVAVLAGVVLLPEYAVLAPLKAERNALAHQLECARHLARYNPRMLDSLRTDPNLTMRLMIRHGNYRPAGARPIEGVSPAGADAPPLNLVRRAADPPESEPTLAVRAARWVGEPFTHVALIVLSLGLIAAGLWLFPARRQNPARAQAADRPERPWPTA
jgi:hypothetical protein